jgi:hypothetical protein
MIGPLLRSMAAHKGTAALSVLAIDVGLFMIEK